MGNRGKGLTMSEQETHDAQGGIADALGKLSAETGSLVRQEMARAREEMWEQAKQAAPAAGLLALGGALGLASAASAYRLTLRILEAMSTPGIAAFLATAGFGTAAVAALTAGRQRLRTAPLPFPTSTAAKAATDVAQTLSRTQGADT